MAWCVVPDRPPTSDLALHVALHKQDLIEGFTRKYRVHGSMNPEWVDLFNKRTGEVLDGRSSQQGCRSRR